VSAGICVAALYVSSDSLVTVHSMVWSEPLFLFLALGGGGALAAYAVRPRFWLLLSSAMLVAGATVTRYVGLAFVVGGAAMVLGAVPHQRLRLRMGATLLWCAVSCTPFALVGLRNVLVSGTPTNRAFVLHPISPLDFIRQVLSAMVHTWTPRAIDLALVTGIAAVVLILLIVHVTDSRRRVPCRRDTALAVCCLLFAASYLVLLYVSLSMLDAGTPIDGRIMSPVFVFGVIGITAAGHAISTRLKRPLVWRVFVASCLILIPFRGWSVVQAAGAVHAQGLQYTSRQWHTSEGVAFARSLGQTPIYSNHPPALYFWLAGYIASVPSRQWG
jgi:hypothetical protein